MIYLQAKENPDLLKEKNVEIIMKYDLKTMNKSTKVLPPMKTNAKLNIDQENLDNKFGTSS